MKLPSKTVRVKNAQPPTPADLQKFADESGADYKKAAAAEELAQNAKKETNNLIKSYAEEHGETIGSEKLVLGKKYIVGYQNRSSITLSVEEARNLLTPQLFKSITKVVPAREEIVENLFQQAVDSGKISAGGAKRIMQRGPITKYIVVKEAVGNKQP